MWRASILTIFPEMFPGPLGASLAGKALAAGLWTLDAVDIRAHAADKRRSVDDTPAGGGPGMVMRPDVLARAVDALAPAGDPRPRLALSPRGVPTGGDHAKAAAWRRAEAERLTRARRPDLWAAHLAGAGKPKRPGKKPRRDG